MRAVNNYIIVEKIKQGPKKVGGLILTEDIDEDNRYIKANVISIGNLVEGIKTTTLFIMTNMLDTEFSTKIHYTTLFAQAMWY